jgi:hypothetical protein
MVKEVGVSISNDIDLHDYNQIGHLWPMWL